MHLHLCFVFLLQVVPIVDPWPVPAIKALGDMYEAWSKEAEGKAFIAEIKEADPDVIETPAKKLKPSTAAPLFGTGAVIMEAAQGEDDVIDLF